MPYNGGFGRAQLEWLDQELRAAAVVGERVVLNSHVLLDPRAGDGTWVASHCAPQRAVRR